MRTRVRKPSRSLRYGAALAVSGLALIVRLAMDPVWGQAKAYLTVFPAVLVATWFGGRGPGYLATILCVLGVDYFWAAPAMSFSHKSAADVLALLVFLGLGAFVCHLHASVQEQRERARTEKDLADKERRAREDLMAIVAHDLRTPLQTIRLAAHLLRRADAGLWPAKLGIIERAVNRMDHLIRDLLSADKLDAGELRMTPSSESAAQLVSDAIDSVAPIAQERGIELSQDIRTPHVRCDRERVLEVLGNLLTNAVKFTPEGGTIAVRVLPAEGGFARFEVADTGHGVSPEHLPHIFERRYTSERAGTGLGLFIASGIVRGHGGSIWATSEPGVGTTIFFTLPRAQAPAAVLTLGEEPRTSSPEAPSRSAPGRLNGA